MADWDDLRIVLAVARTGSFSAAARGLGINHTTVARRITSCEARLGARLFERLTNGYRPTPAGEEAISAAERMEEAQRALERQVMARDRQPVGAVTLTAPLMIVTGPFMSVLSEFRQSYPQITLRISVSNDLADLHQGEADVAIRATDTPDERLFGVRLTEQRAAFYLSPDYLTRLGQTPQTAMIDWIATAHKTPPSELLSVYPKAQATLALDDKIAAQSAARAGMGICRLPCFVGDTDPGLVRLPHTGLMRYPDKWILTHPDLKSVERVRLVMRFAADAVKTRRGLFMGEGLA